VGIRSEARRLFGTSRDRLEPAASPATSAVPRKRK
jgi:hypothetical protein